MGFPSPEQPTPEYVFEKPEVAALVDDMIRVSQTEPDWEKLIEIVLQLKGLADQYGADDPDLHSGIFQHIDRITDDTWHIAFNFWHNVITHPGTALGIVDALAQAREHPYHFPWVLKFLPRKEVAAVVADLKQKLQLTP